MLEIQTRIILSLISIITVKLNKKRNPPCRVTARVRVCVYVAHDGSHSAGINHTQGDGSVAQLGAPLGSDTSD